MSKGAESLVAILAPHIGEHMARASVAMHLQKLGLSGPTLTPAQAEPLIEKLGQGLNVFLGRAKAATLMVSMKSAVGGGSGQ